MLLSPQPRQIGWAGYLIICAIGLSLVLTWLGPSASEGLGTLNEMAFWFAHVSIGLALLAGAQLMLGRIAFLTNLHPIAQVVIGGIVGAIAFTPAAFGLDLLFHSPGASDSPNEIGLGEVWTEFLQFIVPFIGFWLLLNAPTLVQLQQNRATSETTPVETTDPKAEFWQKVPKSLGRDLIALSAELHYLRVYTTVSDTLILFAFGRAVELLDDPNTCQVHRSHWVSLRHVTEVKTGNGAMDCILSSGLRLPVSRRHRKALKLGIRDHL